MLVSFYGSLSLKLLVSVTTNRVARSGLISGKNDSLGGREPENETDNFGRCLLGRAVLNWIIAAEVFGIVLGSSPPKLSVSITANKLARS